MYTLEITSLLIFGADIATEFFYPGELRGTHLEPPGNSRSWDRFFRGGNSLQLDLDTDSRGRDVFVVAGRGRRHNSAAP